MANDGGKISIKWLALVVTDAFQMYKQTKNSLSTSATIATLFSNEQFYYSSLAAESIEEVCSAVQSYFLSRGKEEGKVERKASVLDTTTDEITPQRSQRNITSEYRRFFEGITNDFHRVVKKRYCRAWVNAFKSIHIFLRGLNAIIWLFFNTTVPCLSAGLIYTVDSNKRNVEKILFSESVANTAFCLVGG